MAASPQTPLTMAELARRLGLARSTVSMALQNNQHISKEVRAKVQAAAAQFGYRTNPLIRTLMVSLKRGRRGRADVPVIAIVHEYQAPLTWYSIPFFVELRRGLYLQAERQGYRLEEFQLGGLRGLSAERLHQVLRARGIHGVFLAPLPKAGPSQFLGSEDFALATANVSIEKPALHRACLNYWQNMVLAWRSLRSRGYERIGLIHNVTLGQRNEQSYYGAYLACGLGDSPRNRVEPLLLAGEHELTSAKLATWKKRERPQVVIVTDAGCLVPRLLKLVRIPEAFGLVSLELVSAPPGVAGIVEHVERVGTAVVDIISEQFHRNERGLPAHPEVRMVAGEWRDGFTLKPSPSD